MKENDSRLLFAPGTVQPPADPPLIIADGLRTPENVGSLVRLAANIGITKVVLLNSPELKVSKMRKTACMAWDYVEVVRMKADELKLPEGYEMVAVETSPTARNIYSGTLPRKVALVLGSEVHGVSAEVLTKCAQQVYIPMTGPDTSMNVTHAAAVALFEWVREWVN